MKMIMIDSEGAIRNDGRSEIVLFASLFAERVEGAGSPDR